MEINVYTLEDSEGNEEEFSSQNYQEARDYAQKSHLKVICNEFEFSDSYLVDDFTRNDEERTETGVTSSHLYRMTCGHEHDSPRRLTRGSSAQCPVHGMQAVTNGEGAVITIPVVITMTEEQLQRFAELDEVTLTGSGEPGAIDLVAHAEIHVLAAVRENAVFDLCVTPEDITLG
jgi:hypothetical protein